MKVTLLLITLLISHLGYTQSHWKVESMNVNGADVPENVLENDIEIKLSAPINDIIEEGGTLTVEWIKPGTFSTGRLVSLEETPSWIVIPGAVQYRGTWYYKNSYNAIKGSMSILIDLFNNSDVRMSLSMTALEELPGGFNHINFLARYIPTSKL